MKEIGDLKKDLKRTEIKLISEYSSAAKLLEDLNKIENDVKLGGDEKYVLLRKDLAKARRTLRWLKRPSSRLEKYGKEVEEDLKKISALHPPGGVEQEIIQLNKEFTERLQLLATQVSRFGFGDAGKGKINEDMEKLSKVGKALKKYKSKPEEFNKVKSSFDVIVKKTEEDTGFLVKWIRSTEIVLNKIKVLDKKLESLSS